MQHPDHSHAHRPNADDHHGRRAELESVVIAHQSEGLTPPSYALRGLAALESVPGSSEILTD